MATQQDRMEEQQLLRQLNQMKGTPEVQVVLRLLAHRLQEVKESLVECPSSEFERLQGQGVAYSKLIREIQIAKPVITKLQEA